MTNTTTQDELQKTKKTPWMVGVDGNRVYLRNQTNFVCNFDSVALSHPQRQALGAFIVGAVNAHDEAMDLLRVFVEYVENHRYQLPETNENEGKRLYRCADRARAIVEASGRTIEA